MVAMKHEPATLADHAPSIHQVTFALGYLFAMAEMGLYCPLCMTDGVARIVTRHGTAGQVARVVPRMGAWNAVERWTGAMFVTERAGGSDVGANETIARRGDDGSGGSAARSGSARMSTRRQSSSPHAPREHWAERRACGRFCCCRARAPAWRSRG